MSTTAWQIAGLSVIAAALLWLAVKVLLSYRENPDKREKRRRSMLHERGRLGYGTVTDVAPHAIYYAYAVGGVEYRTAQDVTDLAESLPPDRDRLIGPVTLKYSPRNPANSIVLSEQWSGLRNSSSLQETKTDET